MHLAVEDYLEKNFCIKRTRVVYNKQMRLIIITTLLVNECFNLYLLNLIELMNEIKNLNLI